jgi:hypothetical protein
MNIKRKSIRGKVDWLGNDGLDVGMYKEAAKQGKTFSMLLEEYRAEHDESATKAYIGKSKVDVLRAKTAIRRSGADAPLTAVEELLQAAGLVVKGQHTDYIGKFYEIEDIDVLFPEFISDRVFAGLMKASLVPEFCFSETVIDSTTYQKIYMQDVEDDRQLRSITKGEDLPEMNIKVGDETIRLNKYGRYVKIPYEDLKYVKVNVFGVALDRVGLQIGIDQTDDMIYTLINGDGNSNSPSTTVESDSSGSIGTADIIEWATALPTPYKMDKFAHKKALGVKYFTTLADFNNSFVYNGSDGVVPTISGVVLPKPYEWDRSVLTSDYFIGVDSRYAIEHVSTGGVMTEAENIIRQQNRGTAISHWDAFAIGFNDAVAIFDETH